MVVRSQKVRGESKRGEEELEMGPVATRKN
jgi:hypothetical protein